MYLPEWIEQHKEPRTEIKKINGRYYKYEVKYVYEKEKKRTVKKTVRLLAGTVVAQKNKFDPNLLQKCIIFAHNLLQK